MSVEFENVYENEFNLQPPNLFGTATIKKFTFELEIQLSVGKFIDVGPRHKPSGDKHIDVLPKN